MLRPHFLVLRHEDEWWVKHDGRHDGPYRTDREAILAAIHAAHSAGCHGHEPWVVVEAPLSKKRYTEWTYGDPFPPDFASFLARSPQSGPLAGDRHERRADQSSEHSAARSVPHR